MDSFRLKNFKCFEDTGTITLKPITLFYGKNNVGKSSILRFLKMLRETIRQSSDSFLFESGYKNTVFNHDIQRNIEIELNLSNVGNELTSAKYVIGVGKYEQENEFKEWHYYNATKDSISIFQKDGVWLHQENDKEPERINLSKTRIPIPRLENPDKEYILNQRLVYPILSGHITLYNNITYLTAYRKPPQYSYSVNTQNQQEVGEAAEFVADILAHRKNENDEAFFGRLNELLKKHLNVTIEVETFRNNTMLIEVVDANGIKNMLPDVGAGIGQVLPIFIQAVLSGEKDSAAISIIEEPESNLNAYSQAELADLFITMAKLGKQSRFLLETHSETLLLRLHRRILEGTLSPDDIAIYVVERPKDSIKSIVKPVEITAQGIVDFPEDFFDADYIEARAISQLQHQTKPTNLTW